METNAFYIRHILAPYNKEEQVQRCIICGEIIHDYRGVMYDSQEAANHNGWQEGEHFVRPGNPKYYTTFIDPQDISWNCNIYFDRKNKAVDFGTKVHKELEKELNNKTMNKQTFIGVKMIAAIAMTLGEYNNYRKWDIPKDEDVNREGYLVEYLGQGDPNHKGHDNYISWSPKEVFDQSYFPIEVADKISKSDVDSFMTQLVPTKLGDKTCVIQVSTLTGFDMTAHSACVDPTNFNMEIGADIAKKDIINQLWSHLGFVLQWAKNGLKAKQPTIGYATAFTRNEQGFYIIDDKATTDGNYDIPNQMIGATIKTNRFSWEIPYKGIVGN